MNELSLDELEQEILATWIMLLPSTKVGSPRERIVVDAIRRMVEDMKEDSYGS